MDFVEQAVEDGLFSSWEQCIEWKTNDIKFFREERKDEWMAKFTEDVQKSMIEKYRVLCKKHNRKPKL